MNNNDDCLRNLDCSVWSLLDLSEQTRERSDVVVLNLAVARAVPALSGLHVARYLEIVDQWTRQFAAWLPRAEQSFHATPSMWKNDIRFFRIGMLQGFLSHQLGIHYIEEQKENPEVRYTNPSDLFLNGLIDSRQGTCGNMAVLHVAICRRMGWPVSLACAKCHLFSRFHDGEVIYNIEATSTHPGSFCSEPDEYYIERFKLPPRAIASGSDLRKLTAREMLGVFVGLRGRHYRETARLDAADSDYALARMLFPQNRSIYLSSIIPMLNRGGRLFDEDEVGHPNKLIEDLKPAYNAGMASAGGYGSADVHRRVRVPSQNLMKG